MTLFNLEFDIFRIKTWGSSYSLLLAEKKSLIICTLFDLSRIHSLDHLMHSFSALSLISTYSLSSPHHFRISLNFIGFIKNEFGSQLKFLNYLTTIGISHICCGAKYSIETRLFFVSIHTYVHSIEIG